MWYLSYFFLAVGGRGRGPSVMDLARHTRVWPDLNNALPAIGAITR